MAAPYLLQQVSKRPGMYFSPLDFDCAASFLNGFDLATYGGALLGFHEWLVTKVWYGNNLVWTELVLRILFPESRSPRDQLQPECQESAVMFLFELYGEFCRDRDAPEGIRRIHLRYEEWLQSQDWYRPGSPAYIPPTGRT